MHEALTFTPIDASAPLAWAPAPAKICCSPSATHLWMMRLNRMDASARMALALSLSTAERERAVRFHQIADRERYIASHGLMRQILSMYIFVPPASISFDVNPCGKPALATSSGIHFNLSHSRDIALLAVSTASAVGVDVESTLMPLKDVLSVSHRYFSRAESEQIINASPPDQQRTFLRLWTRKEALLKARGDGLRGLEELCADVGTSASNLNISTVRSFEPTPDTIAAIAWFP